MMLKVDNVSRRFGSLVALRDISLAVMKGELRAIIGPNGAGKSSLINVLTGLYRPDQGVVQLDGQDITRLKMADRSRLGLLRTFQGIHVFATMTVRQTLALAAEAPRARQEVVDDGMAKVMP